MIVNTTNSNISDINTININTTTPNVTNNIDNSITTAAECGEFNFLKRRFSGSTIEEVMNSCNNNNNNNNNKHSVASHYNDVHTNNMWKKRHIDILEDTLDNQRTISNGTTLADMSDEFVNFTNGMSKNIKNDLTTTYNLINDDVNGGSVGSNGDGNGNGYTTTSSFINDIFGYDTNLIVPITASIISNGSLCDVTNTLTTFAATPASSICANANYVDDHEDDDGDVDADGDNWQATDLLELDHRYNSAGHTEITHLHPTIAFKPPEQAALQILHTQQQQQQEEQQRTTTTNNFLVPAQRSVLQTRQAAASINAQQQQQQQQQKYRQYASPSNGIMDMETDFEDKNLSWLLNFKFDEFPHLSPDVGGGAGGAKTTARSKSTTTAPVISSNTFSSNSNGRCPNINNNNTIFSIPSTIPSLTSSSTSTPATVMCSHRECTRSPKNARMTTSKIAAGRKFEELVMEATSELDCNDMVVAENIVVEESCPAASYSFKTPKKPPFTYTELIEYALEDKGELTVSGIYQWISDRFPYYKSNDDRWKNSVRHNLSINPHFRKGIKAPQGAGHLWTISSGDSAENVLAWEHKKQRLDLFFKMESMNRERIEQFQMRLKRQQQREQCPYEDEAATAAATITQEMLQQQQPHGGDDVRAGTTGVAKSAEDGLTASTSNEMEPCLNRTVSDGSDVNSHRNERPSQPPPPAFHDLMSDEELRKTAGQILNGIHREVEVQSVNIIINTYHDVLLDNTADYLNPIQKEVAVSESGLQHITESSASHSYTSSHTHSLHSSSHHHQTIPSITSTAEPPSTNVSISSSSTSSQYYIAEIDPLELGIQMSRHPDHHDHDHHHHHHHHHHHNHHPVITDEEDALFNDEFNLNYFGYNSTGNDIVA